MTQLVLTALVNSIAVTAAVTVVLCLILRFSAADDWNASTREAVWWAVLGVAVISPFLYMRSELVSSIRVVPSNEPREQASSRVMDPGGASPSPVPDNRKAPDSTQGSSAKAQQRQLFFPVQISAGFWAAWVVGLWGTASLFMLGRLILAHLQLRRQKFRAAEAPEELSSRVQQWMNSFGGRRRRIRLAISKEIAGPAAVGPFQPTILIPEVLFGQLPESELWQLTLHEVGHFSRRDDYWLLLQRIVEAVFVFNPLVSWITRHIDLEREISCDDVVINVTGRPRSYAICLMHLAEICGGLRGSVSGVSATGRRSHLEKRIDALLDGSTKRINRIFKMRLAGALAALALLTAVAAELPGTVVLVKPVMASPGALTWRSQGSPITVTDSRSCYGPPGPLCFRSGAESFSYS